MANTPTFGGRGFAVAAAALLVWLAAMLAPISSAHSNAARAPQVHVVGAGVLTQPTTAVLRKPSVGARRVGVLEQFRPDFRPQYVLALAALKNKKNGKPRWYRISVPGRPNGRTGWVPASAVEIWPVRKRIIVRLGPRRFEFWNGERLVRAGRVAIGRPGLETPRGLYYVTWKFDPRIDPNWSGLGNYAFETSAYSPNLTEWPGGGIVGMHGTPAPQLLGQAVSHGCIRVHNRDIEFLRYRVPLGTPIKIVP